MSVEDLPREPSPAQVPQWMGALRAEANRALGEFELGVRRATDALAVAIARDSAPHELATFEQITHHCADFHRAVDERLDELVRRVGAHLGRDPAGAEESLRRWHSDLAQYLAGYVDGGGLALGLYLTLPESLAADAAEVAAVLSERLSFLPQRADQGLAVWIAEVRGQLDDRREAIDARLGQLVRAAEALGVRAPGVPSHPTESWLSAFEERLRQIAADRGASVPPELHPVAPDARVRALIARAAQAGLRLGRIPSPPGSAWIDETEARLDRAIARRQQEESARAHKIAVAREARVRWLVEQAARHGEELQVPPFVTEDWLERAELRVASLVLTPMSSPRTVDVGRAARVRRAWEGGGDLHDLDVPPREEPPLEVTLPREEAEPLLVLEEGTIQEQVWRPRGEVCTIGRNRTNTVQIKFDPLVSRRHCSIVRKDGMFLVRDEGSAKGTLVNGVRVDEARLVGGEVLLLGDTRVTFHLRG